MANNALRFAICLAAALLWAAGALSGQAAGYPAIPTWEPDPAQRAHLRRTLALLQTSTPANRNTVRVLFYGQSITEQAWWREVANYLRTTYTNAELAIENRAIGGHSSQVLVKTAEADLYPFQPDLLIFHVYGSHLEYENIIRRVRERTCADILLQTDHLTKDESLTEEMDRAKLSPKNWDAWMNNVFLPDTAAKYAACRADVHEQWKAYLRKNDLKAAALLRDGVHLNAHGEWLLAELLKRYLAPLPPESYDPFHDSRVTTLPLRVEKEGAVAEVDFTGSRLDLLCKRGPQRGIEVLIDGLKPSKIPQLFACTRVSAFPNSNWPLLLKLGSQAPPLAEEWSLKLDQISPDGKLCHFALRGSITGDDGEGWSTNRFTSASGRVVIEPEDWNLAYCVSVFKRPLPEGHTAKWRTELQGMDTVTVPEPKPEVASIATVASGLPNAPHTLRLTGENLGDAFLGVRVYSPPLGRTAPVK